MSEILKSRGLLVVAFPVWMLFTQLMLGQETSITSFGSQTGISFVAVAGIHHVAPFNTVNVTSGR